jgi:RNA polymerase sigma factor (TIGR02999 family)
MLPMSDVTQIFSRLDAGDPTAAEELLPLVYDELRRLAAQRLAQEKSGQTLQATALVHEAYLRLVGGVSTQYWDNRGHFFAAAAEAMRRILIDNARRKRAAVHGGQHAREGFDEAALAAIEPSPAGDILALDEALTRLASENALIARLVELRFFAGLTQDEAAALLGISRATAARHWAYARAWLRDAIDGKQT